MGQEQRWCPCRYRCSHHTSIANRHLLFLLRAVSNFDGDQRGNFSMCIRHNGISHCGDVRASRCQRQYHTYNGRNFSHTSSTNTSSPYRRWLMRFGSGCSMSGSCVGGSQSLSGWTESLSSASTCFSLGLRPCVYQQVGEQEHRINTHSGLGQHMIVCSALFPSPIGTC